MTFAGLFGAVRQLYRTRLRRRIADHIVGGVRPVITRRDLVSGSLSYLVAREFVDDVETVTLTEPPSVGPMPAEIREKVGTWTFDRPFVATLEDVQLVGPNALPIAPDGAYVLEAVDGSSLRISDELVRTVGSGSLPVRQSPNRTMETVVPMTGPWCREFFHWFADYLPRLRQLERLYGDFDAAPPLLVPADPPDWIPASLDLIGVDEEDRIRWSGDRVTVHRLVVPSIPRHTESTAPDAGYVQSPRAMAWVADRLQDAVNLDDRPAVGRRLYVSRAGQSDRDVVNESDFRSTIAAHGFEVVCPEEWSLKEQVAAFTRAEAVCGPHGGGLVNFVYADSDATLLELFGERTNPCFYTIAAGMGRRYAAHRATAVGDHLRVDPEKLSELLSMVDDWPQNGSGSR